MSQFLTTSNILAIISLLGMLFTVFLFFRIPQEKLDKQQSLTDKEVENKAVSLERQVQWEKEANERRFKDMNEVMTNATTLAQNHIHTIDTKVDSLTTLVNSMNLSMGLKIAELSTIIAERIPRKENND